MGRTAEVSEADIIEACEELCVQQGGDPRGVSGLKIRSMIGGSAQRVNATVKGWREGRIGAAQAPRPASDAGELPVEVDKALVAVRGGLDDLARRFTDGLAAAIHDERRRASAAARAAEQAATARLEQEQARSARAEEEVNGLAGVLDVTELRAGEAEGAARELQAELAVAQEAARIAETERDRLAEDRDRLRAQAQSADAERAREAELRAQAEKKRDALESELAALAREHAAQVEQEQEQHRGEREADRVRAERLDARLEEQARRFEELLVERNRLIEGEAVQSPQDHRPEAAA